MANEFPIQFVQFRDERDDFLAEGGGNSTYLHGLMMKQYLQTQHVCNPI